MATGFTKFGNLSLGGNSAGAGIGGTAAAGDWLVLTFVAIDGDPSSVAPGDNVGGAYALLGSYAGLDGYTLFCYAKKCAGGENGAGGTWAGATNGALVGVWISAPTQPELYVIDQGVAVYDPGVENAFQTAIAPSSNAESYLGINGNGRQPLLGGGIRPDQTSGGFEISPGNVSCVAAWNANEGTNTTADRPTQYDSAVTDLDMWCLILGIRDTPSDADVIPEGGLLTGGEIGLAADSGADVVPVGGVLLGGDVELEATGGAQPVIPAGGLLLSGRVFVSAPLPFPVPVRIPENQLGCGTYQVFAMTRGLKEIVTMLPFTDVEWGRILDDTSEATLTIDGVANPRALARCCAALSELEPQEHELAIIRNGWRVWSGPITDLSFPAEQCVIQASDLSWWLTARTIHNNINMVQKDLANILLAYAQDAMSVDTSPGLIIRILALAGQLGDRLVEESAHQLASDAIAELARTGVDWTTLDREMRVGPLQPQPPPFPGATPYPTLIDSNFRVQPTVLVTGSQGGDCFYVNGPPNGAGDLIFGQYGPEFPAQPDHVATPAAPDYAEIAEQYGRIERVVTESRILDQPGIDANAKTRYELLKRPLVYISDGALLPSTPIPMDKLLPGSLVNVHLSNICRVIAEAYRIKAVKVKASSDGSETVDVQWQPLGTGVVLDGEL